MVWIPGARDGFSNCSAKICSFILGVLQLFCFSAVSYFLSSFFRPSDWLAGSFICRLVSVFVSVSKINLIIIDGLMSRLCCVPLLNDLI
jgi:hypothetical protein